MKIELKHLDDLALGSVFLATGGGGDPYVPRLIAEQAIKQFGPVEVIDPSELNDDAYVVAIGSVGAPTVSLELLPSVEDAANTLAAFEKHVGKTVDAVASFEIGGGNSLIPLVAAVGRGLPVIDGDGMGRALPEAQMMSYAIAGVKPTPALAYDYAGNIATFSTNSTEVYERHIRSLAMAAGGMITTAEHPMTGRELKDSIIPGTLLFSIKLGQTLCENRGLATEMLAPLQVLFKDSIYGECRLIYTGKVIDKATRIVGGYDIGEATIESFDSSDSPLSVSIKNEYLLARKGEKVVTSVPDLIVIVDYETSTPINAERLRYGQRVAVFAVGCPQFYRSEEALKVVSPRCFGFDFDYVALEDI
tara:strand:- start:400 stop:1485 length:1086 start_codon:yes stop_codon:yes gene_type:complete